MNKWPISYLWLILLLVSTSALADSKSASRPNIKVEGARFRAMQLAVPEFKMGSPDPRAKKVSQDILPVLRNDLGELSGVFRIVEPKSYNPNPQKEGIKKQDIKFQDWTNVAAEGLVKAEITVKADQIYVTAYFYQVALQKPSGAKTYSVPLTQTRMVAHKLADDAYEFFTGEKGHFSAKIAAVKETAGIKHIVTLDVDGQNMRQVTRDAALNLLPTFTPDDSLLYTSFDLKGNGYLYEIKLDGTQKKPISTWEGLNMGAQVSPDKMKLVLTLTKDGISQVYVTDRNGKNPSRISKQFGIETSPYWSPDGKKLALVSARSGNPQVYTMNTDGTAPERVTFQGNYNQTPRYSPKGDYIAFTGRDEENKFDVFLYDVKSKLISRVTQGQGNNEDPWFLPNNNMLVFTSTRTGKREIFLSSLTGDYQKQITQGGQFWTPTCSPASR